MILKDRYGYIYIAILQLMICAFVFSSFLLHPSARIFCTYGDGIKNYFTLQSFVQDPIGAAGIFKYNAFAYPFGDYVYYTDNTPLFSIPLRWFCHHVRDISANAIPLFNFFIISNLVLCSVLALWILRPYSGKNIISFLLALMLPWSSAQLQRIWCGHFNLSLSVLPVAAIALFLLWYRYRQHIGRMIGISLLIVAFSVFSFLLHGYYMAIITLFATAMLFFYSLYTRREPGGLWRVIIALAVPVLTIAVILLLLSVTDHYLPLRKEFAMGYDFGEQKTIFAQLFTHYDYQRIYFPLYSSKAPIEIEIRSYLGNIGLFTLGVLFVGILCSKRFRRDQVQVQRDFFAAPVRKAVFFAGLLMLIISFGEHYTTNRAAYLLQLPANFYAGFHKGEYIVYGILVVYILVQLFRWYRQQESPLFVAVPLRERAIVLLCASALVYIIVAQYTLTVTNVLNPFWYLHFFTRRVEQFRSIARFGWPFFWAFYLWIAFILGSWYQRSAKPMRGVLIASIILLGLSECRDNALYLQHKADRPNPFAATELQQFGNLHINYSQYQAILPLPYFVVGSEDYNHTINDEDDFSTYIMQMILYSRLPTMACKLSRTPPAFSVALLDLVANDTLRPELRALLNHKPVLIVVDRSLLRDTNAYYVPDKEQPLARALCLRTFTFIQRQGLVPIDSSGNKLFYSWQVM